MKSMKSLLAVTALAAPAFGQYGYRQMNLVSNLPELNPQIVDPLMLDAWGISLRPAGQGGHFWISNAGSGNTTLYVGDVPGVPLYQDNLRVIDIPNSALYANLPDTTSQPTGQVFSGWGDNTDFNLNSFGGNGPAKFLFCGLEGTIAGWRDGMPQAVTVIDRSSEGAMYTGMAVTTNTNGNRILACNINLERLEMYDQNFNEIAIPAGKFKDPTVPITHVPYNITALNGKLYMGWAHIGDDPGEEDLYPGYGYISEFDNEGNLLRSFEHTLELNGPWGMAVAPADFGEFSGKLLATQFGSGRVAAWDLETGEFEGVMRDVDGNPIEIDGIWGATFGNGLSLGYANRLYVTAGPNGEEDGLFASLRTAIGGDADGDDDVDIDDFGVLAARFNQPADFFAEGDFNKSGVVDIDDFAILAGNFNVGQGQTLARGTVPEPESLAALLVAAGHRRRRRA